MGNSGSKKELKARNDELDQQFREENIKRRRSVYRTLYGQNKISRPKKYFLQDAIRDSNEILGLPRDDGLMAGGKEKPIAELQEAVVPDKLKEMVQQCSILAFEKFEE